VPLAQSRSRSHRGRTPHPIATGQLRPRWWHRARGPGSGRTRHGRRSQRVLLALLVTALAAVLAATWYVSGRLMTITHVHDTYPLHVLARDAAKGTIVLGRGPDAAEPGTFRLAWPGGHAIIGAVVASTAATVTRRLSAVHGRLIVGHRAGIEANPYTGDPMSALQLGFSTVSVSTALGAMPAWYLPGRRSTWVILVHGLGGSRADTLPAIPTLHALGYPMLAISYRNDPGAPQSPDHRTHLGATEWHDVASAVAYAMRHGASGVVLYGYSLGGAIALILARPVRSNRARATAAGPGAALPGRRRHRRPPETRHPFRARPDRPGHLRPRPWRGPRLGNRHRPDPLPTGPRALPRRLSMSPFDVRRPRLTHAAS
jgi:hypothetical protein